MTIFANLHRLLLRDTHNETIKPDTTPSATDVTEAASNVVEITGGLGGVPIAARVDDNQANPRPKGRTGRVRTRLLPEGEEDRSYAPSENAHQKKAGQVHRPVGWLVVVAGPGTGDWFALENGLTHLGRGADQTVCLDFGDQAISRQSHAFITYDIARHRFQLSHGESKNRTRLNGTVVNGKAALAHGDLISIGKTTLRIAVFCDDRFSWPPIIDKGGSK